MSKLNDNKWGNICERVDTCALTGAGAFIAGIPNAEIIVNGPLWCYFYALRYLEHGEYDMAQRFHGSQPDNNAVVYGSEKYLLDALERLLQSNSRPELLFIESSCSMSLIGDDLNGIAGKADLPFPFVTMDCGGMLGGFAEGFIKAAIKVFDKFLLQDVVREANTVNILGQSSFYLNGTSDSLELQRLLSAGGYKVQAMPGAGSSLADIKLLGKAALNIVTNEELGLSLAKYLEQRFGTPYILAGLPYGINGTISWLQKINAVLPASHMDVLKQEAARTRDYLISLVNDISCNWGRLWFDQVVVSAPPTVALCMAQAVREEWADMGKLTVICQRRLPQKNPSAYCTIADIILTAGVDDIVLKDIANEKDSVLLLGSSSETSLLYRYKHNNFISCNIAYPIQDEVFMLQQPVTGLKGSMYMLQRLWNAYISDFLHRQARV